ncbi:CynX/NimT family MFS transporter [Chthonobacter rhizosphaerae]|uniref:CynX/NimT family MFS transporter n=1 Tax=Chthonobacter rhizosphaerae TaxID=2735553 RepID=UPI0015EF8033|nr:MFS transporter [Chthonobacter rhizosphaerae]
MTAAPIETPPSAPPPARPPRGRAAVALLGVSLVLVSFNLRPIFPSLSAVLPDATRDLQLSAAFTSLITTLPVLCLGLFAPFAPGLARRFGAERTVMLAMTLLAVGTALRGHGSAAGLMVGSLAAGASIAIGNVLLPSLVKRDFPASAALMTGLYTMALCGGAALAAGVTVPLEQAAGGSWRFALAVWALPALLVAGLWIVQQPRNAPAPAVRVAGAGPRRRLWRGLAHDRLAWQVTLFMGLQSALAYIVFGWLAPMLRDRGLSAVDAGLVVSVCVLAQTVSCLAAPGLAVRGRDQRLIAVTIVACAVFGLFGCFYAPLWTVWGWAVLQGIGQGSLIAVAMTIIVLRSPDNLVAAELSSMAQSVGYCLAAAGPLLAGLLNGWTGSFTGTAVLVGLLGLGASAAALGAGRARLVKADPPG